MGQPKWFSDLQSVCHDNPNCPDGQTAIWLGIAPGTGGKPFCPECRRLNEADDAYQAPPLSTPIRPNWLASA